MRSGKKIGEVLVSMGSVTDAAVKKALSIQASESNSRLLGHILVEMNVVDYGTLLTALSEQMHIPRAEAILADRAALKQSLGVVAKEPELKSAASNEDISASVAAKEKSEAARKNNSASQKPEENKSKKTAKIENVTFQLSKIELPLLSLEGINYLPESKGDIQQIVIMSLDMLKSSDFEEAAMLLEEGLQSDSSSLHLQWLSIWAEAAQKHMKKARTLFDKVDEIDLQNPAFLAMHCYLLLDDGKFKESVPLLVKLTELPKIDVIWYFWIGYALAQTGHAAHASLNYQSFIKKSTDESRYTRFARKQMQELAS